MGNIHGWIFVLSTHDFLSPRSMKICRERIYPFRFRNYDLIAMYFTLSWSGTDKCVPYRWGIYMVGFLCYPHKTSPHHTAWKSVGKWFIFSALGNTISFHVPEAEKINHFPTDGECTWMDFRVIRPWPPITTQHENNLSFRAQRGISTILSCWGVDRKSVV